MHVCLGVDEIVRLIAGELVASGGKRSAVSLASSCKNFKDPVLDALWETQDQLPPLLRSFPESIWENTDDFTFKRIPTQAEWAHFQRYAQKIRTLKANPTLIPLSSDVLSMLQHRTLNTPLLPGLKKFVCHDTTAGFIPFISLFLSQSTSNIEIVLSRTLPNSSALMIASMVATFPKICPKLRRICLLGLPGDPVITTAVSELPLFLDRNALQRFDVDCPLTAAARNVIYRLPKLFELGTVLGGPPFPPPVVLPALVKLQLKYSSGFEWLQILRGAALPRLRIVSLCDASPQIGNFLKAFRDIALTTSIPATLSTFIFYHSNPWTPDYSSLLTFKQLTILTIGNPCRNGCSSTVDDNVVTSLARALPRLKTLRLGFDPCNARIPVGATPKGLVVLATHCLDLTTLRVHIRIPSLILAGVGEGVPPSAEETPQAGRRECSLTTLEVGNTPVPDGSALTITLALLRIFPRINDIQHINPQWGPISNTIKLSKRISSRIGALTRSARNVPNAG